jgi:hypothetical protein
MPFAAAPRFILVVCLLVFGENLGAWVLLFATDDLEAVNEQEHPRANRSLRGHFVVCRRRATHLRMLSLVLPTTTPSTFAYPAAAAALRSPRASTAVQIQQSFVLHTAAIPAIVICSCCGSFYTLHSAVFYSSNRIVSSCFPIITWS